MYTTWIYTCRDLSIEILLVPGYYMTTQWIYDVVKPVYPRILLLLGLHTTLIDLTYIPMYMVVNIWCT